MKNLKGIKISTPEELSDYSISQLTEIYNGFGHSISKFSDKSTAQKRVFNELPEFVELGKELSDREKMRIFLSTGKIFTMSDIAELLSTTKSNANTGIQLLKSRHGKNHTPLVLEKVDGKFRVVSASVKKS